MEFIQINKKSYNEIRLYIYIKYYDIGIVSYQKSEDPSEDPKCWFLNFIFYCDFSVLNNLEVYLNKKIKPCM